MARKIEREIAGILREMGVSLKRIEQGKHLKLFIEKNGVSGVVFTGGTPSDNRAACNLRSSIKRELRRMT
jgi:hypothetical protein